MSGMPFGKIRAYKPYGLATYSDGGLRTSVSQLSHFLAAIMNGGVHHGRRILQPKTVKKMLQVQSLNTMSNLPSLTEEGHHTLSFGVRSLEEYNLKGTIFGHSGNDPGTRTFMYFDQSRKIGVIIFRNSDVENNKIAKEMRHLIGYLFAHNHQFFNELPINQTE